MITPPKATAPPTIKRVSLSSWSKGYSSELDDARTPNDGLRAAENVLLDQNGVIKPWPSMVEYGPQPEGTILGSIGEYKEIDGTTTTIWMITVQNVSGTAHVWIRKDSDAWIECTGKDYDLTADCRFVQVDDKVLVMNGVDNLSYLDIPTQTVIPFVTLTTPTGLAGVVGAGLTGTTYTLKMQVTASNRGETAGSTIATVTVSAIRDVWTGATQIVTWTWNRVTNATDYHLYLADTSGGTPEYLTSVIDPGSGSTVSFVDNGTISTDFSRTVPSSDSTAGPKSTHGEVINGQLFMTGNPDNPREVIYGGVATDVLNFSSGSGGGRTVIGNGGKEVPIKVKSFRDGRGTPTITVLCKSTGGKGKRYIMTPSTLSVGDQTISYFAVSEDSAEDGADAPDSVLSYRNGLWYFSLDGFKTTYTKAQIQSTLSTDSVGQGIKSAIQNINMAQIDKVIGLAYDDKIFFALPVGSDTCNQIWTLDLKKGQGWMLPRNINVDWMTTYQDNSGKTKMIILSNNIIYEMSYSQRTTDAGTAFGTYIKSGIIKFSDDGMEWGKVIDVTFVLLRPRGNIELSISGLTEDNELAQTIAGESYTSSQNLAGWGEDGWGDSGWGDSDEVLTSGGITRVSVPIEVDEELNWFYWELTTTESGVDYALSDVIIRYVNIGTKDLTE